MKRLIILLLVLSLLLPACLAEGIEMNYRFADAKEAAELLLGNRDYYDNLTQNDLNFRLQKLDGTLEELEAFAATQTLDYTDAEKARIDQSMATIEKNCAEPISLNDMAKRYYYSPSYFSRAFKRHFGTTFSVYVQNVRIQKVIAMLEQTDLSVDQISEKLGYSDKRELYRAFKHVTGTTPSRYRRAKQGG